MSMLRVKSAMRLTQIPRATRSVLITLADFENDNTGRCCPKQSTIAEAAGISREVVCHHIKLLETKYNLLKTTRHRTFCEYKFNFEKFAPSNVKKFSPKSSQQDSTKPYHQDVMKSSHPILTKKKNQEIKQKKDGVIPLPPYTPQSTVCGGSTPTSSFVCPQEANMPSQGHSTQPSRLSHSSQIQPSDRRQHIPRHLQTRIDAANRQPDARASQDPRGKSTTTTPTPSRDYHRTDTQPPKLPIPQKPKPLPPPQKFTEVQEMLENTPMARMYDDEVLFATFLRLEESGWIDRHGRPVVNWKSYFLSVAYRARATMIINAAQELLEDERRVA